ncbi:hypothetical protein QJQ45_026267 [Haematococcus lacustris]|nr:hypothetical protein QJQ45_026267 [Haematococcus lacustris]
MTGSALNIRRCAVGPGPRPTELCYWEGRPAMPKPGRLGQEWVYVILHVAARPLTPSMSLGRKLQNAAQKARGRQALQYQFEVIPYFVGEIPSGIERVLFAWERGGKLFVTDAETVNQTTHAVFWKQYLRQAQPETGLGAAGRAFSFATLGLLAVYEATHSLAKPGGADLSHQLWPHVPASISTSVTTTLRACLCMQTATIYKDADGMQKKEYTFKVQSVVKGSKGEDERKTLGKVKVDLAAFCTGELDPTPQDVFLQCRPHGKLKVSIKAAWVKNLHLDPDAMTEVTEGTEVTEQSGASTSRKAHHHHHQAPDRAEADEQTASFFPLPMSDLATMPIRTWLQDLSGFDPEQADDAAAGAQPQSEQRPGSGRSKKQKQRRVRDHHIPDEIPEDYDLPVDPEEVERIKSEQEHQDPAAALAQYKQRSQAKLQGQAPEAPGHRLQTASWKDYVCCCCGPRFQPLDGQEEATLLADKQASHVEPQGGEAAPKKKKKKKRSKSSREVQLGSIQGDGVPADQGSARRRSCHCLHEVCIKAANCEWWLTPIQPHLQHLAAASSAGTSPEANLKHVTVTLATWDAVWEVYLDPKWSQQRLRLYGAQDLTLEQFFKEVEEDMAEVSMQRHGRPKQLVVFFGAAGIGTGGGWGADAVLRACCKVVCRPRGTDQRRGRVVLVDEHRTTRVSSAVNGQQPCEEELDHEQPTRPAGWKAPAYTACSQDAPQAAASESGPSTTPPAKHNKRTKAEPAVEPTQPANGKGKAHGKAAKAEPAPQPGRWLDRNCNAALNMQRIGESRWRPLEMCHWPEQGALPAKAKAKAASMDARRKRHIFKLSEQTRLVLSQGDITSWEGDAIVNAANMRMLGGGGVDGAIHRAAGPELLEACRAVPEIRPGVRCPTGEARITPGFNLAVKHIIHTVGPIYESASASAPPLASAYRSCLKLAIEHELKTIAFPAISTGVYGYPLDDAADVKVHFVLFGADTFSTYVSTATKLFGEPLLDDDVSSEGSGFECRTSRAPRGTDQRRGRVVLVDEHRTTWVSSAVNGQQPCEEELDHEQPTRPAGWKPPAGQVEHRLMRPAWSQQRDQPVRSLMWCPVLAPRMPPQAPCSSQAAIQPAASEPGPSTPPPAKRTKAEPAFEPTSTEHAAHWGEQVATMGAVLVAEQAALPAKGEEYPGLGYKRVMEKDPVCVSPSMLVKDAARLLVDKNLTGAPVVDSAGALVGMLSEADLIWKGAGVPLEHSILPTVFIGAFDLLVSLRDKQQVEAEVAKIVARTVDQAMSKKLHSITPRASMAEAAHLMLEKNVSGGPGLAVPLGAGAANERLSAAEDRHVHNCGCWKHCTKVMLVDNTAHQPLMPPYTALAE